MSDALMSAMVMDLHCDPRYIVSVPQLNTWYTVTADKIKNMKATKKVKRKVRKRKQAAASSANKTKKRKKRSTKQLSALAERCEQVCMHE